MSILGVTDPHAVLLHSRISRPLHRAVVAQTKLLRIEVTNEQIAQMLYEPQPGDPYGLIVSFAKATLADSNAESLYQGLLILRVRPEAITPFTLAMLNRLLQPFQGYFEMDILGDYTVDEPGNYVTVQAESVSACDIQAA